MPIYNLIQYNENYRKTPGILWQYCRDEPALAANGNIADFNAGNPTTDSFKIKQKITSKTGGNGTKNVKIMAP